MITQHTSGHLTKVREILSLRDYVDNVVHWDKLNKIDRIFLVKDSFTDGQIRYVMRAEYEVLQTRRPLSAS